jgi:lipopolysaccharide transport system ATP-binding protein
MDGILDFAEIGEFIDAPLRTYSSGMRVRLGFAVATQMNPDILLVDEVLSVGDSSFRQRCTNWFDTFTKNGGSVIFVSHNTTVVETVSDRVLLLDKAHVQSLGSPHEVIRDYEREALRKARRAHFRLSIEPDIQEDLRITDVAVKGEAGALIDKVEPGDRITICIKYDGSEERKLPAHFEIALKKHGMSEAISRVSMLYDGIDGNQLPATGEVECDIETKGLTPGLYRIEIGVQAGTSVRLGKKWLVPLYECASFVIDIGDFGTLQPGAFADVVVNRLAPAYLDHTWRIGDTVL